MKKLLLVLLCLMLALPCACAEGFTVTDSTGRVAEMEEPAKRVVVLAASDVEILYAIGAGDLLVARGEYCNYPEEVLNVPVVASGAETSVEQILSLAPDAIIMPKMAQTVEQVNTLQNAGVHVIVSDAQTIDGVYDVIELIGAVVGHNDEAAALIDNMKSSFAAIEADIAASGKDTGKTVYFEVSPLAWGLWAAGSDTFLNELAEITGLTNAFSDVSGWAAISEEQVLMRDPDYIVTITMYYGEGPTPVEEIMSRPAWQGLKAVKNGAIYNADSDEISRPGPRLTIAAEKLYAFICGELCNVAGAWLCCPGGINKFLILNA